jgi:hypothetical protein
MKKIKIFLCDMVHNYLGAGTYMFPLNIGYLAAYLNKFLKEEVEIGCQKCLNSIYSLDYLNIKT